MPKLLLLTAAAAGYGWYRSNQENKALRAAQEQNMQTPPATNNPNSKSFQPKPAYRTPPPYSHQAPPAMHDGSFAPPAFGAQHQRSPNAERAVVVSERETHVPHDEKHVAFAYDQKHATPNSAYGETHQTFATYETEHATPGYFDQTAQSAAAYYNQNTQPSAYYEQWNQRSAPNENGTARARRHGHCWWSS